LSEQAGTKPALQLLRRCNVAKHFVIAQEISRNRHVLARPDA